MAFEQQDRAEENAAAATSAETTSDARRAGASALITDDLDESMLLAVAGVRLDDSPETRSSLLAALGRHPEVIASTELSGEEVLHFDVSPDGTTVATYDLTNRVRLYDLASGTRLAEFQAGDPARLGWSSGKVRFSPDGSILAVTMRGPHAASGGAPRRRAPWSRSRRSPGGRMVLAGRSAASTSARTGPFGRLHVAGARSRCHHPAGRDVGLRLGPGRPAIDRPPPSGCGPAASAWR